LLLNTGSWERSFENVSFSGHLYELYWKSYHTAEIIDAPKARREKKEAFKIDFLTPAEKNVSQLLLKCLREWRVALASFYLAMEAEASKKSRSSRKAKEEKRDEHTLPDDMHFSSRQLVTLSLKPKFSVGVSLFARDNKCWCLWRCVGNKSGSVRMVTGRSMNNNGHRLQQIKLQDVLLPQMRTVRVPYIHDRCFLNSYSSLRQW